MSRKRKDNKQMKQFVAQMSQATDADLRNAKYGLLDDLMGTKKKAQLISLEKRIEAIEDIQYDRDMAYLKSQDSDKTVSRLKSSVKGGFNMKKFAGLVFLAAAAACAYYVKVNDIRFPDLVDKLADFGIEI